MHLWVFRKPNPYEVDQQAADNWKDNAVISLLSFNWFGEAPELMAWPVYFNQSPPIVMLIFSRTQQKIHDI